MGNGGPDTGRSDTDKAEMVVARVGRRRAGHSALASDELVMVRGEAAMRVFIHLLLNFLHRTDRERRAFYGTDIDMAAISKRSASPPSKRRCVTPPFARPLATTGRSWASIASVR